MELDSVNYYTSASLGNHFVHVCDYYSKWVLFVFFRWLMRVTCATQWSSYATSLSKIWRMNSFSRSCRSALPISQCLTHCLCLSLALYHPSLSAWLLSLSAWLSVTVSLSLCTLLLCLPDTFSLSFSLTLSSACSISCLLNVSFYASTLSVCLTLSLSAWLNVPPSTLTHCPSPIPPRPDHRFCVSVPVAWRIERRGCYPHHKLHVNVWVNWCIESTLCAHLDVVLLAGT